MTFSSPCAFFHSAAILSASSGVLALMSTSARTSLGALPEMSMLPLPYFASSAASSAARGSFCLYADWIFDFSSA